jgi:DNA-binding GntR family transcriptional regulator
MLPEVLSEPVHLQLARICRTQIARGTYKPDQRFPSEREIAAQFKVSRTTANKVVADLIAEGLLSLQPGVGTLVVANRGLRTSLRAMESFTDSTRLAGLVPETKVLSFRRLRAAHIPEHILEALEIPRRGAVYYFERLRIAEREPVVLEHRWVRADLVPGLTAPKLAGSFYHYLEENHGIHLTGEKHKIHAANLTSEEAEKFHLKRGAAVLVVEGTGYTEPNLPVWYQILFYRGDRYELENEVHTAKGSHRWIVQRRNFE